VAVSGRKSRVLAQCPICLPLWICLYFAFDSNHLLLHFHIPFSPQKTLQRILQEIEATRLVLFQPLTWKEPIIYLKSFNQQIATQSVKSSTTSRPGSSPPSFSSSSFAGCLIKSPICCTESIQIRFLSASYSRPVATATATVSATVTATATALTRFQTIWRIQCKRKTGTDDSSLISIFNF